MELFLENFVQILELSLKGLPLALGVFLIVEALKAGRIIQSELQKQRAPIIIGLILAALWASVSFVEVDVITYRMAVETIYQGVLGGLFVVGGYQAVKKLRGIPTIE